VGDNLEGIGEEARTVDQNGPGGLPAGTPAFAAKGIAFIEDGRFDHGRRSFVVG
jgi:hypothetical protein